MHEMSLTQGVLNILEDYARTNDFKKVKTVWLEIGQLSHVEPEALTFCFDVVMKDTIADGAKLEIIHTPGQASCLDCAEEMTISSRIAECPKCGSYKLHISGGEEMRVKELEVE
ncbi:protein involved with the maturation of hydrogenases 1 and 2 [Candidatus Terasakiella magnetica]|uniref:Hydrogenase maturation factor HypA n=1 Tax=Candidatus Terasakiella magnetica TaxID=1867952 RepID=A0A1C3RJ50_9PROT|nr:hydrogenase maturation nickel metallochaperone HypA [Candidatus Terasakiella magnetica]SCA57305.1 protein involved with the maturation of hydrogenases 1 and 2 [Candidatus Terasakiella magnetica]